MSIQSVNIIGTGKVGTNLIDWFKAKGIEVKSVFSRSYSNIAEMNNCNLVTDIKKIDYSSDLNILCVKDDEIENVVCTMPNHLAVVHTSGSVPITVLNRFKKHGILYPLQTFTTNRKLDLTINYFLLETSPGFESELEIFCKSVFSNKILFCNSNQRAKVHLAAVFANNFTNHMLSYAEEILVTNQMDFEILKPLVEETVRKAFDIGPAQSQTGPAVRKDFQTIEQHEKMILDENMRMVYRAITQSLLKNKL